MTRSLFIRTLGGLLTACVIGFALWLSGGLQPQASDARQATVKRPPERGPLTFTPSLASVDVTMGIKDKEQTTWEGRVRVSEGRVAKLEVVQGGLKAKADGTTFSVLHRRPGANMAKQPPTPPTLRVTLDAPATARVTLTPKQGEIAFNLGDLVNKPELTLLDGQVRVERPEQSLRLTGKLTEDDYPALTRASDGTVWLAYVEYLPGPPVVLERLKNREFDGLAPTGNGDRIRLVRFDGRTWHPPEDVTDGSLDIWRPSVAVDGKGNVVVAWAQQIDGNWDIYSRRLTPGKDGGAGTWSDVTRHSQHAGSDFHVVAAADSTGTVWLAWQAWRNGHFDIALAALGDNHAWSTPRLISSSPANDWSPAIAADSKGNVHVAWDSYDKGNYDVHLKTVDPSGRVQTAPTAVASSARFEGRPSVACDAQDRLWIAYEEGDEQWGKDFATDQFKRIPLEKNPGFALYINRTVKVKCLANGKLQRPAGNLEEAMTQRLKRNKSLPRLAVDKAGGVWLVLRHHPSNQGAGEVWNSFALRYDGQRWSMPRRLADSADLLDHRPALTPFGEGVLAVYSGDNRLRTQNREQDDLFAAVLQPTGPASTPQLTDDEPTPKTEVPVVHADEAADVARLRSHRVEAGGKKLQLVRGEFHRHTEYSAHRDIDGTLEDAFRYALDAGGLDWMGAADHDNGNHHEYMWWKTQKTTDLFHNPPHFVAVQSYERSNVYPNGHRNVIMPRRGIRPLPRDDLKGTPEKGTPDTKLLYAYLKHFGGICSSHTSGTNMGTDWRDNDPDVEPVVEIYQGHRHSYEHEQAPRAPTQETNIGGYQPAGYVWNALEKGYKLGFQTSSDHISTHMSYGVVLVEENSRQGLINGFKKRHSYAATDNILLIVRSGDRLLGDIFDTPKRPTLEITAHGTTPIAKLHIIRDNKYVHSTEPKKREVSLTWTDMDANAGKTSYYYVRVEQEDGNLAWASPMWITQK